MSVGLLLDLYAQNQILPYAHVLVILSLFDGVWDLSVKLNHPFQGYVLIQFKFWLMSND